MSTPTLLDYPGLRYAYNAQQAADSEEYATKDAFTGATADDDGTAGLVPAPEASADVMLLCSDGTWKTLADLGITTS